MKILIRAREVKVTKALRAHVKLRLGLALSRFGEHIGQVAVHLSKSDARRDLPEKLCRIDVGLPRCVKVQETDADVFAAVDRAADRAARSVARAIEQIRIQAQSLSQPLNGKKLERFATPLLVPGRKADIERLSRLKRRYSSAPLRKSLPRQGV